MIVGIMQPYFMPYLGYWQLINAVDKYVIYDDVNFIKGGWINRNRILINGAAGFINIPMVGASSNKLINQIGINTDVRLINKIFRMLENSYSKAPYYSEAMAVVERGLKSENGNLADLLTESIRAVCEYLDIKTEILVSSEIEKNCSLRGQDKVIDICHRLGATDYYNAIGGRELYSYDQFAENGLQLHFLKMQNVAYSQFKNEFVDCLSIIDVMMFNSREKIMDYLKMYELVDQS